MKSSLVRSFVAAAMLPAVLASAGTVKPAVQADVVISHANQSFGFAGPLRYFDASESGGRIGLDLRSLGTPQYMPRPDIGAFDLRSPGNHWQLVGFSAHDPLVVEGTCAVESFTTTEGVVTVQHVYLNCTELQAGD